VSLCASVVMFYFPFFYYYFVLTLSIQKTLFATFSPAAARSSSSIPGPPGWLSRINSRTSDRQLPVRKTIRSSVSVSISNSIPSLTFSPSSQRSYSSSIQSKDNFIVYHLLTLNDTGQGSTPPRSRLRPSRRGSNRRRSALSSF